MKNLQHIRFEIPAIDSPVPVVSIGAGGIVKGAQLPAYHLSGIKVQGIYDLDNIKAKAVAEQFAIPNIYTSMEQLVNDNQRECIYDIAVPGNQITGLLSQLPENCYVLMQKPMGENIQQAKEILQICRQKNITAGVNFQMRYAPYVLMTKQMIAEGLLGDLCDLEIYVNVYTPWHLWNFLKGAERVEVLYHSIHYIDLLRNLLGEPFGIISKTTRHPKMKELQEVKSNIIMDYGDFVRVHISTNHVHEFGIQKQDAFIKIEGTRGAVKIRLGLLMNYPDGVEDVFEYTLLDDDSREWKRLPINGSWFPHAFIGSMNEIIKTRQGLLSRPDNSVEDCIHTMQLVEEVYRRKSDPR